jgi:NADH-ubiquinone oxidoreductase chain 6
MFFLYDNITNGFELNILNIISVISIYCGILVITTKNPVVSVLFLITLFFNVACYLILIGLNFIGLSYLLVYVGAVSILFLFILMLINIRISELLSQTRNSIPLVIIVSCLIYFIIINILPSKEYNNMNKILIDTSNNYIGNIYDKSIENINYTSNYNWDGNLTEYNPMASMGNIMFTSYPMWLILTSIVLLLGMAGVIVITIGSSSNTTTNNNYKITK